MKIRKDLLKNWALILLVLAIGLSRSVNFGFVPGGAKIRVVELRIEDFLLLILGIIWIISFIVSRRKKIKKPPLLSSISIWLGIGLFSVLINWIFSNIEIARGFFYFLKEIEFFLIYFYVFYNLKTLKSAVLLVKTWFFVGIVNVCWVIYQILIDYQGIYGQEAIPEPGAPLPSGGFFLMIFIFSLNIFLYYFLKLKISVFKKIILAVLTSGLGLGVLASGSRDSTIGFAFALLLSLIIYFFKERKKLAFLSVVGAIAIFGAFILVFLVPNYPGIRRSISSFDFSISSELKSTNPHTRPNIWKTQIAEVLKKPQYILFGYGKSAALVYEESHSQYVRNFMETGIIGSLAFLFLFYAIIKKTFVNLLFDKNFLSLGLSAGLLVAAFTVLLICIPSEAFMVVKISEIFWYFAGITLAVLRINEIKEHE